MMVNIPYFHLFMHLIANNQCIGPLVYLGGGSRFLDGLGLSPQVSQGG